MKRQLKRKMASACHSLPRRICFNAIAQIEIRKPGRKWEELFANGSCSRRPDGTSVSLETILETGSSPSVLFLWHLVGGYYPTADQQQKPKWRLRNKYLVWRGHGEGWAYWGLSDKSFKQLIKPSVAVHLEEKPVWRMGGQLGLQKTNHNISGWFSHCVERMA